VHDLTKYSYSFADIQKAVHGIGMNRKYKFRYDVYNMAGNYIDYLRDVSDAEISVDNGSKIKKSINLTYKKSDINLIGKKLKPSISFLMPDGNYLSFPQGTYIIGDIGFKENGNSAFVDVTMYDEMKRLENDKVEDRFHIAAGTNYIVAIREILLRFTPYFTVDFSELLTPADKEYSVGTSYLEILSDLLKEINYADVWTDQNGIFRAKKKKIIADCTEEYIYTDDTSSIQYNGVGNNSDYFSIPNKWIVVASNPETTPLTSILINQADIDARGQTVTRFESIDYIANQTELNEYTRLLADNDKVTDRIEFETAIVPFHEVDDIYNVINSTLEISAKYMEKSWSMPLEVGAKMKHIAERKL
jgi:hypothetical protein